MVFMREFTLAFVRKGDQILLGKKLKKIGAGRWNGFGGKIESGETVEEAMARELVEECGLTALKSNKRAVLNFAFRDEPSKNLVVHVFEVTEFSGEPIDTDEMLPKWFDVNSVPYHEMLPADKSWFPPVLEGETVLANFTYTNSSDNTFEVLEENVQILPKSS